MRLTIVWIVSAGALLLAGAVLSNVDVEGFVPALGAAAAIGLVNALLWPLAIRLLLPITVLTLGLGSLVLNGAVVLLVAEFDTGLVVNTLGAAIVVAFVLTVVNTAVTSLLAIDDDDFFYRNVVKRRARRTAPAAASDVPGLLFLEIDGLAYDVVLRAMRDGNAPTMARWLRDGSHRLTRWETDWSSQTGACQAGLLHGDNDDMPAFRWWEKDRNAAIVTNHPKDAAELERRHSDGRGLLFADGASRANILSGDAPHSLLTMSTVAKRDRPGRIGQDYFAYFANPYNVTRTLALVIREVVSELWSAAQQRRLDVRPRVHRGFVYALMRAWGTIIQRDLQVQAVIADMYAGRPVTYTTFLAYDEVAHHSGVERPESLLTLRRVDRELGRIAAAAADAARPYRLVVLADHGQSQGATFLDRYGITLEALVREAAGSETVAAAADHDEAAGYLGAGLIEAGGGDSAPARAVRRATRRSVDDRLLPEGAAGGDGPTELPEIVVMASGCLGLVSFPRMPGRVTIEQLDEHYPGVIPALRDHPGVGFLLVRSERHGALAIGAGGVRYLDEDRVDGDDPLAPFGPNAARHVRRTDGFAHCPDIVLNSTYWAELDEVAAFEELVGSHGGMGGAQSHPFVLHPVELTLPDELVGAEAVHREFRRWLVALGHDRYAEQAVRVTPGAG
ncbi:MAG TPA: phage holin family protein [Solirubrobacteraceae bacterium]|nr:phage holin family protein [Solirubrobacteraceae bacterium]